jgi:hypothetical protein
MTALCLGLSLVLPALAASASLDSLAARRLADTVARRYGLKDFHKVASIAYVFNLRFGGKEIHRRWTWHPAADSVTYSGPDASGLEVQASWSRRNQFSMESPAVGPLDRMFVNDQYWLLFPLHLAWDKGLRLEAEDLGPVGETHRLSVIYPPQGGYTPGDAYDLFLDSSGTVLRWIFRKGNASQPTREALWSPPEAHGPLLLSLDRKGPKDDFHLWFTDVKVEARK